MPTQTPLWQVSAWVQELPSLQVVPSVLGSGSQWLVLSLHTPMLHWSAAPAQLRGAPPHVPSVHVSFTVQKSPSSQDVPLVFGGFEQWPVVGLQVPASWHWSEAVQTTGFVPVQVPL